LPNHQLVLDLQADHEKKKMAISASFTRWRRSSVRTTPPSPRVSLVCHSVS